MGITWHVYMAFQTPIASTSVYKGSFFPQTIRDWNARPDSLISTAEITDDCVAKFTSLVRTRLTVKHWYYMAYMAFQTPIASTDVYKCIFFPQAIRDWNVRPDSLISSAEIADDCVAKFTSLVRARD